MTTYSEAVNVRTASQVQTDLVDALANPTDPTMVPVVAAGFSPTSAVRGTIALSARALAAEETIRAEVVKATLLVDVDQRDPEWIDRSISGFFMEPRLRATYARWRFTLTNESTTGGPYTIQANKQLEAEAINGARFRNIDGGVLQAGFGATLTLEFEATTAGLIGNIGPGDIFKIMGGALPGVTISNAPGSQTVQARAEETNAQYLARAYSRWGTLAAGGHNAAVIYRILRSVVTITKVGFRDDNPNGPGSVDVFLAGANGPATLGECSAAEAAFKQFEPLGSRGLWRYLPATQRTVVVQAMLTLDAASQTALADAQAALAWLQSVFPMTAGARLDSVLLGGILRGGRFDEYVTRTVDGTDVGLVGFRGVSNVELLQPSGDVVLAPNETLVLDVELIEG